ncbi:MAG TPA: sugar transferase [Candidatus Binataceae bacterium]|nr:sugar transferase [Candidatus Binataceae bacterium]
MHADSRTQFISFLSRLFDLCCIAAAFAIATAAASSMQRFGFFFWPEPGSNDILGWPSPYVALFLASLLLWAITNSVLRIHQRDGDVWIPASPRVLLRAIAFWLGVIAATIFLLKLRSLSRQFTVVFLTLAALAIIVKCLLENYAMRRLVSPAHYRHALVFGEPAASMGLMNLLSRLRTYDSVAFGVDPQTAALSVSTGSHLSSPTDVFVMPPGDHSPVTGDTIMSLLKQCSAVHIVPALLDTALFRYSVSELGGIPVITLSAGRMAPWQAALKRLVDLAFAITALLIFAPLMGLIAIAVKLTSSGPVFFRQERLGKDRCYFRIFKFRTMRVDAEALLKADPQLYNKYSASNFKLAKEDDFRVTPLGRFLRSSSLDELPQLFNVLTGDMSLVGPRPIVPAEIEQYDDYAKMLLSVKPGMTGYWQVNGRSLITDYAARVRLDMEYIRDQSLRGDLQIMLKTVGAVTRTEGAH